MFRTAVTLAAFAALIAPTWAIAQDEQEPRRIVFGAAAADPDSEAASIRFSQCESDGDLVRANGTEPAVYDENGALVAKDCDQEFRQPAAANEITSGGVEIESRSDCEGDRCASSVTIGNSPEERARAREVLNRALEE